MRRVSRSLMSIALVLFAAGSTGVAFGQVSDSGKAFTAALVGRVTDTAGTAIADVEIVVSRVGDSIIVGTAKSNKKGNITLKRLPAGGPYAVIARKIGYGAARGNVEFQAGDTLYIDFELPPLAMVLAPITVTARRNRFRMTADEINPKLYRDALWMIAQRRHDMIGDPESCPLPDTLFGGPSRDGVSRIKITDRIMLGGGSREARAMKRPWLAYDNLNAFPPSLPYVQRLYVNGVRIDWPPVNGKLVPGRSVGEELRNIPLDQIAEMRYVDCWDQSVPPHMQYALYVTLKPPSQEVQDSILRSILKKSDSTSP